MEKVRERVRMRNLAEEFKEHYQSITEHAKEKGVSRQAVFKSIQNGHLNGVKIGHCWYVKKGG